jgi:hypothetical protein
MRLVLDFGHVVNGTVRTGNCWSVGEDHHKVGQPVHFQDLDSRHSSFQHATIVDQAWATYKGQNESTVSPRLHECDGNRENAPKIRAALDRHHPNTKQPKVPAAELVDPSACGNKPKKLSTIHCTALFISNSCQTLAWVAKAAPSSYNSDDRQYSLVKDSGAMNS